jgi:hypothetical protein
VLNATLTAQIDEQLIESGAANTAPPSVRFYNPRVEASATILGAFTATTFQLGGISFTTLSAEKSETAGDVVKTSIRGTAIATSSLDSTSLTTGNHSSASTIRVELRISNTDYQRKTVTAVDFSGT